MRIIGKVVVVCGKYFQEEKIRDVSKFHDLNMTTSDVEEARDSLKLLVECGKNNDFTEYLQKYGK